MKSPSIRCALLIRCGIGVGVLLCLLSAGSYLTARHGLYRELDRSLEQTAALLANQLELEQDRLTFEWQEGLGTNRALLHDGLFQYWNDATGLTTRSPELQARDLPQFSGADGSPMLLDIQLPASGSHARAIGLRIYPFVQPHERQRMIESGHITDPKSLPHTLVVARDATPVLRVLSRLRWILGTGTLLTLGLGFALIDRAVRVSLRPINLLTLQMRNRAAHQLDSALVVPGTLPSELTELAGNFDSLLTRVAATRRRERDFIRHAAHELRTPIAALRATTDLALSQTRDAAAYAGHLETCRKTAVELGGLVQRLTELARIGRTSSPATLEPIDLENLLDDCLQSQLPVVAHRKLKVTRTGPATLPPAAGDRTLVRIVCNNLLDNAASHTPPDGEIALRFRDSGGRVELSIANPAEDLPEDLDRLFEPLFRRETCCNSDGIHLGIGLALSLEAATATGATLQARMPGEGWIEFVFTLPVWHDGDVKIG